MSPVSGIEALRAVGGGHEQLCFPVKRNEGRRAMCPIDVTRLRPFHIARLGVKRNEVGVLLLFEMVAGEQDAVFVDERNCADGDVEVERFHVLAPDFFTVHVEGGEDGRAEADVDTFAVGGGRISCITPRRSVSFHGPGTI